MHLYILTRAIRHEVQRFIEDMSAQYFNYPNEVQNPAAVQTAMRPIQLWEVVFPKGALPEILKTINYQPPYRKDIQIQMGALRRLLKAKKIPKIDLTTIKARPVYTNNVGVYPIGIREDKGVWQDGPMKGGEML